MMASHQGNQRALDRPRRVEVAAADRSYELGVAVGDDIAAVIGQRRAGASPAIQAVLTELGFTTSPEDALRERQISQ
jgi:hypothetical protein